MKRTFSWAGVAVIGAALVGCGGGANTSGSGGALAEPPRDGARDDSAAQPEEILASNADRPRVATPAARASVEDFRPAWWVEEPETAGGVVRVGAMGEGKDTLEARGEAVRAASLALRGQIGHDPEGVETERYTVVQLTSGQYRAFVLMSGRE